MTLAGLHHVTLRVPDVPAAERYYATLFDLNVHFREGSRDGEIGTLPADWDWDDAADADVDPSLSVIGRDHVHLELTATDESVGIGHVRRLALDVGMAERIDIRDRAEELDATVTQGSDSTHIEDRYGFEWELTEAELPLEPDVDELAI